MNGYPKELWAQIRERWESGESAHSICRDEGMPSRPGIEKKARTEGWERHLVTRAETLEVAIPEDMEPRRRRALEIIAQGGLDKDAAAVAHVSPATFTEWKKDPEFLNWYNAVITATRIEMLDNVRRGATKDPKHAQWWLQHHPQSRGDFGADKSPTIGNQYNILAHVQTGIDRDNNRLPSGGDEPVAVIDGRVGDE